ncbi:MAG TPA: DUF707 domain-containing protein [Casimicrobiaceae bacterium]|nr:DUF707 domain-containing protein [Casimicrobiaceae bacterium]
MSNRFLVVVRAGDRSLHPGWTRSLAGRDWDLLVSYFGDDRERFRDAGCRRIDDKGPKWRGLHAFFTREDFWQGYDYVMLPDDDLAIEQETVSRLFARAASRDLELCQPALSWWSYYSHAITVRHPSFALRFTDFVEIMTPCFSRRHLERCLPTFAESVSGWGFDRIWPRMLAQAAPCAAIVDECVVTHTRPVGGPNYAALRELGSTPHEEGRRLLAMHGISPRQAPRVLAAIDCDGRLLRAEDPQDAATIEELCRRDRLEFIASRRRIDTPRVTLPRGYTNRTG